MQQNFESGINDKKNHVENLKIINLKFGKTIISKTV